MQRTLDEFKEAILFLADDMGCLEEYAGLTITEESLPETVQRLVIEMFVVGYVPGWHKFRNNKPKYLHGVVVEYMKELREHGKVCFKQA